MKKAVLIGTTFGMLLWSGVALATPTPQQQCDYARITAWKVYTACVDTVVAKDAKGVAFDEWAAFAKCRHAYFKNWATFQTKASLVGSTCAAGLSNRFIVTDNGTTVTDGLTGLVWEKKTNMNGGMNFLDPDDADNTYMWSTGTNSEDGTAFTDFLAKLNGGSGFAGANGWRLPTLAELQSILLDFTCTGIGGGATCSCGSTPCVDGTFDAANTQSNFYWSATGYVPVPTQAWFVTFLNGYVNNNYKANDFPVRAVRGGL